MRQLLLLISFGLVAAKPAFGEPEIQRVKGQFTDRQVWKISGAGFLNKYPAEPLLYADFSTDINPTQYGRITTWAENQNMIWSPTQGPVGNGCAMAANGNGVWALRVDYDSWTRDGQKSYVFKRQRTTFPIVHTSQNWKILRMWPSGFGYPNIYAAENNGRVYVENIGRESGFWGNFRNPSTNWTVIETQFRASSAIDQFDGELMLKYDGAPVARGNVLTRSSAAPRFMIYNYVVHGVMANPGQWTPPWDSSNRMYVSEVYVDDAWSRVMLGDSEMFATCTQFEIQIPAYWSDNYIEVVSNKGQFPDYSTVYLYVFDSEGNVNSAGYPIRLNLRGPIEVTTPTIVGLSPLATHGKEYVILGENFETKLPAKPLLYADFSSEIDGSAGLNPSPLGIKTTWDSVKNMVWSPTGGPSGGPSAVASNGSGDWALTANLNYWTIENADTYIFKHEQTNFTVSNASQRFKPWKIGSAAPEVPNLSAEAQSGRIFTENIPDSGFVGNLMINTTAYVTKEIMMKASSAIDVKDGRLIEKRDGRRVADGAIMTRSFSNPNYMTYNHVVYGFADAAGWNPAWKDTNRLSVRDVYVDTTLSRVILADGPTLAESRNFEIQIPKDWRRNSITIQVNAGEFPDGANVYVYVFDRNGNVNPRGYPITLSKPVSSSGGTQPPAQPETPGSRPENVKVAVFNPARGESVRIFPADYNGDLTFTVHDRSGRVVRRSSGRSDWDGKTDSNAEAANGLYLVRMQGQVRKVVVLK